MVETGGLSFTAALPPFELPVASILRKLPLPGGKDMCIRLTKDVCDAGQYVWADLGHRVRQAAIST
jgi:hypothetical protein